MEKTYAQALWILIDTGTEPKKAIHALHDHLVREGRQALMPKIATAFKKLADLRSAAGSLVLTVADKRDEHKAHKEIAHVLKQLKIKDAPIETVVDETLIGGWRLEGRDHLVDESHKKHLLALYTAATT